MAVPTTTALVSGGPNAMLIGGAHGDNYLNLSDSPCSVIGGLAAFTIEFFVKFSDVSSDGSIVGSHGKYIASAAADSAFSLVLLAGGTHLSATMFIGGASRNIQSTGSYLVNTLYHVAMTYDGTTVRLFKNGVLDGSVAASGAVQQKATEIFSIGPLVTQFPESGITYHAAACAIDSIRASNVARYIAPFTAPTAKFVTDANTLILLNFNVQYDIFTIAQSSLGDNYLLYRSFPYNGVNANIFTITGLSFYLGENANGPLLYRAPNSQLNIKMLGGWQGLYLLENCYVCRGSNITGFDQKKFSICLNAASAGNLSQLVLTGGMYPLVACDSGLTVEQPWIQSGSTTIVAVTFIGNGSNAAFSMRDFTLISEDGGQAQTYGLVLSSVTRKVNISGYFQCPANTLAAWVDTCASVLFLGNTFDVTGTAASVIHVSGTNGTIEDTSNFFEDPAIPFSN